MLSYTEGKSQNNALRTYIFLQDTYKLVQCLLGEICAPHIKGICQAERENKYDVSCMCYYTNLYFTGEYYGNIYMVPLAAALLLLLLALT